MRVRAKISYMALLNRMTIVELFAKTIKKVYYELQRLKYFEMPTPEQHAEDEQFLNILKNGALKGLVKNLVSYNFKNLDMFDEHAKLVASRAKEKMIKARDYYVYKKNGIEYKISL